jgi:hypothetical protein
MDGHDSLALTSLYYYIASLMFYTGGMYFYCWTHFVTHEVYFSRIVTNYSIFSVSTCVRSVWLLLMQPKTISQFLRLDEIWSTFEFARSGYVILAYTIFMYLMLHDTLTLTSLSL